jgi:hypothetical protein
MMTRLQRVLFRIGAWACLVTAGLHLIGHFSGGPAPANETEATMQRLMKTYTFDLMGVQLTMSKLVEGYSLTYSLFLVLLGLSALAVIAGLPESVRVVRRVALLNALAAFALLGIGLLHFPPPPNVCAAIIGLAFAGSLLRHPERSEGSAVPR